VVNPERVNISKSLTLDLKGLKPKVKKAVSPCRTSGTNYQATQHHIPEGCNHLRVINTPKFHNTTSDVHKLTI
jgi:hypothetical protein